MVGTDEKKMNDRKQMILDFMKEEAYKPMSLKELAVIFGVPKDETDLFHSIMEELEKDGKIIKTKRGKFGVPERMNLVVGRIQGKERGYGFLVPDNEDIKDIFIPADSMNGAMHNDRAIVRINKTLTDDKSAEGEVIRIIQRANKTVVGTFESSKYFGFVVPDNSSISGDIFIPKDEFNGAKQGQKVVAEIIKWPEPRRNAEGRIIEIIGDSNEPGTDITAIIRSYNLPESFPEEVIKEADSIDDVISEEELKGRRDLRNLRMMTIDGEDAKDLDDAVSIEKLPDGIYRLGVHIADVSHYVKEGSYLDKEALKRGTSVYLVDRVIPMLPQRLSNGICSLNPHVDRLAFTVMMDIDGSGRVINHEIFESVININERMTYTNVYKILEEHDEELINRYSHIVDDLKTMKELALILREKRRERGAIDFDFDEAKIILDEKGKPIEVKRYEITIANKIIEEFMLVCNETVAEHFYWANVPFIYRIHEEPDSEKMESFSEFVYTLGYKLKHTKKMHPKTLQELLEKVKGKNEERIISTIMLRSLQKAKYSHEHDEHFGLAAKFYSHFTSPIRRYPDLMIHRIMKEYIKGRLDERRQEYLEENMPEIARICSERERVAEEAERETEDLKKVEFMKMHEGEIFEGIISNVTSFGMFVELDNTIEGLVRLSSMDDDYYIFNEKNYSIMGERTRKVYKIGNKVNVQLARADVAARQIDFILVQSDEEDEENPDTDDLMQDKEEKKKQKKTKKQKEKDLKKAEKKAEKKAKGKVEYAESDDEDELENVLEDESYDESYDDFDEEEDEVPKPKRSRKQKGDKKVKLHVKGKKSKKRKK